jgi:Tfp pilus assembly protein PilE
MLHTSQKTRFTHRRMRGFALAEFGFALLIAGVLMVAAVYAYNLNSKRASIKTNVSQIQSIAATAKASYGQGNRYGSVTTAVAVQGHIVPDELRDGNAATASNAFGGAITFAAGTGTGANDLLVFPWANTPASQCNEIVTGTESSMRRVAIAGTDVKPLDGPLNVVTLTTQCEVNGASGNVVITFYVGRS